MPPGFIEIATVCTRPSHGGRGYGTAPTERMTGTFAVLQPPGP